MSEELSNYEKCCVDEWDSCEGCPYESQDGSGRCLEGGQREGWRLIAQERGPFESAALWAKDEEVT